jgi:hypothetical protein
MRTTAQRKQGGQALRDAMRDAHVGLIELARRTRETDPAGKGVSHQLIGFLTQDPQASRHARETCSIPTAELLEDTLAVPRGSLFTVIEAPSRSDPQPGWDDLKNVGAR